MKKNPSWPVVSGPLASLAAGYRVELEGRLAYSRWAASAHLYLLADVSRWLDAHSLSPGLFDADAQAAFLADRREAGHVRRLTGRGLLPLTGYLRGLGVLAEEPAAEPVGPVAVLLAVYVDYMVKERGLAEPTVTGYGRVACRFLLTCSPDPTVEGCGVEDLDASQVHAFVLGECSRHGVGHANNVVTALRSLLRFLHVSGRTPRSLTDCVPRGAAWRDSGRSRALVDGDVEWLLASCSRDTAIGRRDFAVLTVLARLGLRASEVASLTVDDVDWRAGLITVAAKARRDRLPLPADVGEALADYCRNGRPSSEHRILFLHGRAPYAGLSRSAVSHVVVRACRRAGLPPVGAHRLRHTAASAMRRSGAPLFEIEQVLRHRWVVTTALYAKDDLDGLRSIARPWPGPAA